MRTTAQDREYLGRRVRVLLDPGNPDPAAVLEGVLVELTDEGEVTVETDRGRRYGWPAMRVCPLEDPS